MRDSRRSESESIQGLQHSKLPRMSDSETSVDHISTLPDSILQHILSFLPVKDFIKTGVLSKRWRSIWAAVPVLRFDFRRSTPGFESFISKTLANYRGNKVKELCIKSYHEIGHFPSQVYEWIRFATDHRVEELTLTIMPKKVNIFNRFRNHRLCRSIFSNSSLRILKTEGLNLKPSVSVNWTSLQVLTIAYTKLTDDSLASILLGSPNLQYLELTLFVELNNIIVTSSNMKLRELVLECWFPSESSLEISAPHVHSLRLKGSPRFRMIKLINLLSLIDLNLNLRGAVIGDLTGLIGELHRAQKLRVDSTFLQNLSTSQMQMLAFPLPLKCQSLLVHSSVEEWDFHRIVTLLQATPYLSQLKIVMDNSSLHEFDDKTEYWESLESDVKCDNLTTVFITGFEQSWCVGSRLKFFSSMVEFLLKHATALEKMVIYAQPEGTAQSKKIIETHTAYKLPDLSEVKELISSYPTASLVTFKTYFD